MNLSIYIGRNCVINPQKGRICDYKHQFDIKGILLKERIVKWTQKFRLKK